MVLVRVDADITGDSQRLTHDRLGIKRRISQQRERCCLSISAATADGDQSEFGFEYVAVASDDQ